MTEQQTKWGNTLPAKGDWVIWDKPTLVDDYVLSYIDSSLDLSPIPLTTEVMERIREARISHYVNNFMCAEITVQEMCGAQDLKEIDISFQSRAIVQLKEWDDEVCEVFECSSITHLHHLQQLYRLLTGKELTIDFS